MSKKNATMRKPKRKNANKVLLIVLIVLLVLAIAGMIGYAVIDKMTTTPPKVNTQAPWASESDDNSTPVAREEGSYNFLVVGKDVVALNTDVMMIVNLNLDKNSMAIMQLPRDTFVMIDNSYHKLNAVYGMYYNNSSEKTDSGRIHDGMKGLASVLSDSFAINIDFYANLNLDAFGTIVDTIGGVDMYVPFRMKYDDIYQDPPLHIDLYEGQQTLNGDQAQQFVRFRSDYRYGDTSRQNAQKLFMTAFMETFAREISITNVGPIMTTILSNLTHSLEFNETVYFVKEAMGFDFSNITMLSAPNTPLTVYGGSYVILHRAAMYDVINEHFNVFDTDIPDATFDKAKYFTMESNYDINAIYNSTEEFEGEQNAQDIIDNGIDIDVPLK